LAESSMKFKGGTGEIFSQGLLKQIAQRQRLQG
jgi:hypothetical protein